ncbi:MAG: DUF4401 domain-containing protein [Gammaproteobacteria bacterium]|nr:DUF4401 domain-containing protein [Gammaproteobacteria bacterium]
MTTLDRLCDALNLDLSAAREAMSPTGQTHPTDRLPWYVRVVVGVSAWLAAVAAIALAITLLDAVLHIREFFTTPFAIVGLLYFAAGAALLLRKDASVFTTQLGIALGAAGLVMASVGLGFWLERIFPVTLFSLLLSLAVIVWIPSATLQFIAGAWTAAVWIVDLVEPHPSIYLNLAVLSTPLGVWLMIRPGRSNLQPTALVLLLLYPLCTAIIDEHGYWPHVQFGVLWERSIHSLLFVWLTWLHYTHLSNNVDRGQLLVFAILSAGICLLLLPPGGSTALVILMLAFVLGSRPLALLGTLLEIDFLWRFYYSLHMSLLHKSWLLISVGLVLLLLWWLSLRASTLRSGSPS